MQDCSAGSSEEKILPFGDYDVIPGTTGLPKGVTLTHISFLNLSQNMKHYVDASTESNDIEVKNFLALIPWFHAYGFITTSGVLSFRLGKVFLTRFEDKLFLETVQNYKDALILSINGALGGIELTYITVNNDIVTFTMRDSKTKTARSLVIRDEIPNEYF
ncbi:luciferin 4-monooxygenase-like [Cydia pomonella]|uniref:luciferin 4-monooxygenase-like n=1 Tax=Cydia pomonella TaxID=82600 RepID=UPI002ADE897B|nr:luciferin 4-monooxygenase-like [Cydia pomonella]XP_061721495.1 luciferin 4-monooxygenase-like [Cydia pomonella]XP_061721496.1 luciferin 4-monooxygenase-like [Cydia pomonella]